MNSDPNSFLTKVFDVATKVVGSNDKVESDLPIKITKNLDLVLAQSESSKGVFTVILVNSIGISSKPFSSLE